jgi:hypothetical protein
MKDKALKCKRVKCKDYAADTCTNRQCTSAHEEDGYKYLTEHRPLSRDRLGLDEPSKPLYLDLEGRDLEFGMRCAALEGRETDDEELDSDTDDEDEDGAEDVEPCLLLAQ